MSCWGVIIMAKFEIGDEVECVKDYVVVKKGMTGKVVNTNVGFPPILVAWDDFNGKGHNGGGKLTDKNGYWVFPENITHSNFDLVNE